MFKQSLLIAAILLTQTLHQTTSAQELAIDPLTESDFFSDIPIVLSATRLKQSKQKSPIASTIIDRQMIEASGFTEIVDLLRLAPGMLVNNENGHIAAAGYQFLFTRYIVRFQVMVDGMSVYAPSFGEMPWTQLGITIDDIDRIEVIRGPSSASYGPNAMTGVISIITRHAVLDKGVKFKSNQGTNGRSEQFFTFGSNEGDLDYRLSLGKRKDDGFEQRFDNKDQSIINFRGDYQATNNDTITFSLSQNKGDYQEDSSGGLNDSMPEHMKYAEQSNQQTKWIHSFNDGDTFSLNYYQQTYSEDNKYLGDFTTDGFGFVIIDDSVTTNRNNIEFTYSTQSDSYKLTLGGLYRKDNTLSPQYLYNVNRDIITKQIFANSEYIFNQSNTLNFDLLYDDNDTADSTVSPRISLNHHINKNNTIRIAYSEATRSPFALEEYTNRVIYVPEPPFDTNFVLWTDLSDLKPEKIKSFDIGYIASLNNNATEIDARIYKNSLSDIIVLDNTMFTGGFVQGDEFDIRGLETTVSHNFKNTKVIFNYARTKISAGNLIYSAPHWYETGTPKNSASLLIMHSSNKKLNTSIGYYYTDSYQQICCEADLQPPRKRLDFTLSKSFMLGKHNSKIKLVIQNITNHQVTTRFNNNYDRQGYISFSMTL